jgi:hypothetical protein
MIILRIKKKELDAIKTGIKKNEWRNPSLFNKKILLKKNKEGLFCENTEKNVIKLINGYKKDSESILIETNLIRPVRFSKNIEIAEDNFKAKEGDCSIQIVIDKILNI